MSTIGNVTLLPPSSTASQNTTSNSSQSLTQQDFLKLMVAQFTQQDPLASSDGSGGDGSGTSDYIDQLMSMTNLTTMQTMSGQQAMLLADTLPGASVDLSVNGNTVSGVVQGASMTDNGLEVTVNGQQYPATDIVNVDQTSAQAQAAAAAAATTAGTNSNNTSSN